LLWKLCNWQEDRLSEQDVRRLVEEVKQNTIAIASGGGVNVGNIDKRLRLKLIEQRESQPTVIDQLAAWFPDDLLIVKYKRDSTSGSFTNIESGSSAGQRAAAILSFLLSYGEEPLIIDQPEDDLDNELIYDLIVKQIHKNKTRRQLIIATHNPNIVVNGIAELIGSVKFIGGQVQLDTLGGLGDESIIDSVCTIMEGGKPAFEKRYKRITLGG